MRNTPPLSGALRANEIVRAYSDNREINSSEWFLIYLANNTQSRASANPKNFARQGTESPPQKLQAITY